jgi:hypothetical protein
MEHYKHYESIGEIRKRNTSVFYLTYPKLAFSQGGFLTINPHRQISL